MNAVGKKAVTTLHRPREGGGDIVVIEGSPSQQMVYRALLADAGHRVRAAATASEGIRQVQAARPAVLLLDLGLTDRDGLELLHEMLRLAPGLPIIAVTANGSVARAVEAMRAGAHDFLVKPVEETRLLAAVSNSLRIAPGERPALRPMPAELAADAFLGTSSAMRRVEAKIASVAGSMATVFITGESGTGKELAALAVHRNSMRGSGPFIALNCGAIPHDLMESEVFGHVKGSFTGAISDKPGAAVAADGGTLFLDEVCEMAPALQTKLLRFLQTSTVTPVGATRPRRVNVRIVCATNRDPLHAVRRGQFREDLYYRLYVVPLHMPPLRERGNDVIEIATAALERFASEEGRSFSGLSAEVTSVFRSYEWPGNVRQLLNVMRNVVVLNPGGLVTPAMLPDDLHMQMHPARMAQDGLDEPLPDVTLAGLTLAGLTLAQIERRAIETAIARHRGSVPRAARELDVSPSTLYRKIEAWGRDR